MTHIDQSRWGPITRETTEDGPEIITFPRSHPYTIIKVAFEATPFIQELYLDQESMAWLIATVVENDHLEERKIIERVVLEIGAIADLEEWYTDCPDREIRKSMRKFIKQCDRQERKIDVDELLDSIGG